MVRGIQYNCGGDLIDLVAVCVGGGLQMLLDKISLKSIGLKVANNICEHLPDSCERDCECVSSDGHPFGFVSVQ